MRNWKDIYVEHQAGLEHTLNHIDTSSCDVIIEQIKNCNGKIIFTGIGKSWAISEKIASMYRSVGINSIFLDPINCLHGDMNLVNESDLIFLLSKSGETFELANFAQWCKNNKRNTILVTSNANSYLSQFCDDEFLIPIEKEADHLNKVPSVSSANYMIIFQCFGLQICEDKKLSKEEFTKTHPGGILGKV